MLGSGPPPEVPVDLVDPALPFWLFYCKASATLLSAGVCLVEDCISFLARKLKNRLRPYFMSVNVFGEKLPLCV